MPRRKGSYEELNLHASAREDFRSTFRLLPWGIWDRLACGRTVDSRGLFVGGGSSSKPQVGAIAFTDVNGTPQKTAPTSLTVGQGIYVDVNLTNDPQLLGADWSVTCGSAPPPGTPLPPGQPQDESCGTFTPAHTISGPIPSYVIDGKGYVAFYTAPAATPKQGVVTLFASSTVDHTRFTSVTLTIGGLPISVGFAPAAPSVLGVNATVQLKAALTNDATNAGVNWSVLCGSTACGSFSATQTISGVITTYTAPAAIPNGGTVKVTATSVADPTKAVSSTIQIVPISISVTPQTLSVGTAATTSLIATVAHDGANKGADWSVACTNTKTPGSCGTITAHTMSGAEATYTAPSVTDIAVGSTIVITATSTADSTKSATATVTTIQGDFVAGLAQAAHEPLRGALVTLYAAMTSDTALSPSTNANNVSAVTTAMTDSKGGFSIPYGYECPKPDAQMYLVSTGGNAGSGINPDLSLLAALGPCSHLDATRFVINEATTVAAVYALSGFMKDAQTVGSASASPVGMVAAFSTAADLVDVTSGVVHTHTVSGIGVIPRPKINTLANLLSACAKTAGSAVGDGSACDRLFRATNPGATTSTQASNTLQALLDLVQKATGSLNHHASLETLYELAASSSSFGPAISANPDDWTLSVQFPNGTGGQELNAAGISFTKFMTTEGAPFIDPAGNVWIRGNGNATTEFVGGASYARDPQALIPTIAATETLP